MPNTPKEIVQEGAPVLRGKAEAVLVKDIVSKRIQMVLRDMRAALEGCDDGVAIAAPQIGVPLRIFIVSHRAFEIAEREDRGDEVLMQTYSDMVFINPEITKVSKKRVKVPEGCLSVRWLYGNVLRHEKAAVRAYDETGKAFTYGASGLLAQIFQHETDHLNGVLFIDTATDVEEITPEELDRMSRA